MSPSNPGRDNERVELDQWWPLIEHVAQRVGQGPGAESHERLGVASVRKVMADHLAERITNPSQTDTGTGIDGAAETPVSVGGQDGRERPASDSHVQVWLAWHADLIATRLDALVDDAVTNPQLWMETITPPPPDGRGGESWRAAMREVVAYRDRYQVTDPVAPLGPRVLEGERGEAYTAAVIALEAITTNQEPARRRHLPGPRPMDRVPVVLADARARAAQVRRDANERARRDAADRAAEHARSLGR